jgi:hypothetical protein
MAVDRDQSRGRAPSRRLVLDRLARTLEQIMPLVRGLIPPVRTLALLGAVAAAVNVVMLWRWLQPLHGEDWVIGGLGGALLLAPAALLGLFWLALREVREVPGRIRALPDTVQRQRDAFGSAAREIRAAPGSNRSWLRGIWQVGRTLFASRDELLVYVPLAELLNPLFLLGVVLSVPIVVVETVVAIVLLTRWWS